MKGDYALEDRLLEYAARISGKEPKRINLRHADDQPGGEGAGLSFADRVHQAPLSQHLCRY